MTQKADMAAMHKTYLTNNPYARHGEIEAQWLRS